MLFNTTIRVAAANYSYIWWCACCTIAVCSNVFLYRYCHCKLFASACCCYWYCFFFWLSRLPPCTQHTVIHVYGQISLLVAQRLWFFGFFCKCWRTVRRASVQCGWLREWTDWAFHSLLVRLLVALLFAHWIPHRHYLFEANSFVNLFISVYFLTFLRAQLLYLYFLLLQAGMICKAVTLFSALKRLTNVCCGCLRFYWNSLLDAIHPSLVVCGPCTSFASFASFASFILKRCCWQMQSIVASPSWPRGDTVYGDGMCGLEYSISCRQSFAPIGCQPKFKTKTKTYDFKKTETLHATMLRRSAALAEITTATPKRACRLRISANGASWES